MPIYLNEGSGSVMVRNTAGLNVAVAPGETVETYQVLTMTGMTLTAAAPYWNPVPASGVHDVTSSGSADDQSISLNAETDQVEIYNGSAALVTVYLRAKANTPGMVVPAGTKRTITGLKNMVNAIVMTFSAAVTSGQCYVTEIKE